MKRDVIKIWNARRGFGFIARDAGRDVLLHHAVLTAARLRPVSAGDVREFEAITTPCGPRAASLRFSSAVADIRIQVDRDLAQAGRGDSEVALTTAATNPEPSAIVDWAPVTSPVTTQGYPSC
jgi:CspA family cold shock protein